MELARDRLTEADRDAFVGVDGGSSAVRAAICDRDGNLLASGTGPGLVPLLAAGGSDCLREALESVAASIPPGHRVASVFLALTGVDLPDDAAAQTAAAVGRVLWPGSRIGVGNDGLAAWAGATGCEPGIAVMAGTGCVVVASDDGKRVVRTGGWGPILGDAGGGWGIGLAALREMLERHDVGAPPSALDRMLLVALGVNAPLEVPGRVTGGSLPRGAIADLARIVTSEAARDPAARRVLDRAARALASDACRAIDRLPWPSLPIPVIPTGNAFHPAYMRALGRAIRRRSPVAVCLRRPVLSNVGGAALLALREAGREPRTVLPALIRCPDLQPGGPPP